MRMREMMVVAFIILDRIFVLMKSKQRSWFPAGHIIEGLAIQEPYVNEFNSLFMLTYFVNWRQETLESLSRSWHIAIAFLWVTDQFTDGKVLKTVHAPLQHFSCMRLAVSYNVAFWILLRERIENCNSHKVLTRELRKRRFKLKQRKKSSRDI